ncbi:ABC transporter substrate-binding protein [Phytoactinopolyspora halotolerans]|uniref:ABC transporter substrate-binding protein n=1 Tax=Phytoactinopolyspora halotolerans TaxID=1981512 RepID=A0A6L9SC83_9ACTN|nr:ABC transporter substrate-binding protein [Phytoactinopolyspora halotolerans]NEE02619.1 ABC transporter substrate-binding protein [Phytoactinopolyspora halotolerans]
MSRSLLQRRPMVGGSSTLVRAAAASVLALALVACGGSDDGGSDAGSAAADESTNESAGDAADEPGDDAADGPGDDAAADGDGPSSVVALSSDAAEAVRALAGVDRLVAVPASTTNETLGNHPDEMAQVPNMVPPSSGLDPEQVLAWEPDLVVLTARHDGEEDAEELLQQTDVPLVAIENNWGSVTQVQENYRTIARALGTDAEQRADELITEMEQELAEIAAEVEQAGESADAPTVLVLTNQAENPFIAGPESMTADVVRRAGGIPAVEEAGIRGTMPADPEQIVSLAPDAILLVDVMGKGEESFGSLLGNDAVAGLPAVAGGRVLMLPSRSVLAAGGVDVVDGIREVAEWLRSDAFAEASAQ